MSHGALTRLLSGGAAGAAADGMPRGENDADGEGSKLVFLPGSHGRQLASESGGDAGSAADGGIRAIGNGTVRGPERSDGDTGEEEETSPAAAHRRGGAPRDQRKANRAARATSPGATDTTASGSSGAGEGPSRDRGAGGALGGRREEQCCGGRRARRECALFARGERRRGGHAAVGFGGKREHRRIGTTNRHGGTNAERGETARRRNASAPGRPCSHGRREDAAPGSRAIETGQRRQRSDDGAKVIESERPGGGATAFAFGIASGCKGRWPSGRRSGGSSRGGTYSAE